MWINFRMKDLKEGMDFIASAKNIKERCDLTGHTFRDFYKYHSTVYNNI